MKFILGFVILLVVILSGCAARQPLIQEEDLLPSETMLVWEEILVDLDK